MTRLLPLLVLVGLGCEELTVTPGPEVPVDGGSVDGGIITPPNFETTYVDGGAITIARALDDVKFIAFDLDTGQEAPFDGAWDIAFRRQRIRLRGGVNGDGGVVAVPIPDAGFDDITRAPDAGYLEDLPDGDDPNTEPDTVFENAESWYSYDVMTHVLTARRVVYVVRSDERRHFKVVIERYYDTAGTPAVFRVRWGRVEEP